MTNTEILDAINNKQAKQQSTFGPLFLLLGTAALFLVIGVFSWSIETALLLVAALFIHECGHLIAMRAWRYKNLKMLFIPFFGAVASGEPDEQDAYKIAVISIAGPLVGLVGAALAAVLWIPTRNGILADFAYLSVLLNAFNLLPILPLDGGHFVNEILLARYPKAELCFKIVATIALFALAAKLEMWALAVIGVFILMTMKVSYDMAVAVNRLRATEGMQQGELDEGKIGQIREQIAAANPQVEHTKNITRLPAVISATWARIHKVFPGPGKSVPLLAGYLVIVLVLIPVGLIYTAAIKHSGPTMAYASLGNERLAKGDPDGAMAAYSKAIALSPNMAVLFTSRGIARYRKGDFDGAIIDLNRGLEHKGEIPLGYYVRGLAKAGKGDFSGAIGDYNLALGLKAADPIVLMERGSAEAREGRFGDAIRDLDHSITLESKSGEAWWIRGYVKDLSGNFAGAAVDYGEAASRLPAADYVRFRWALVLRRQQLDDGGAKLDSTVPSIKDPWTRALGEFLTNRLAETDLLVRAGNGSAEDERLHQCQALYYVGMIHLLRKEQAAARDFFGRCLATDMRRLGEFGLARAELVRLGTDSIQSQ